MKKRLKINGVIIGVVVLLIVIFPGFFLRPASASIIGKFFEVFGIVLILSGQLLRVSSRGYKSDQSRQGTLLIQGGPYTLVRNPMYLGILLIGLGIVAVLFKWWVAGIFLIVFYIRYIRLIFEEEEKLQKLFPEDYPVYQKRVPRILPSLPRLFTGRIGEYLPLKSAWIKKEIGTILAVLFVTLLIAFWKNRCFR